MSKLFIPLILGTIREPRWSEYVAKLIYRHLEARPEVETQFIDIRQLGFDFRNEGEDVRIPQFSELAWRANGYVIVSPEYNHSYPGSLKMVLDTNFAEYFNRAVGIVGVSKGNWGGTRMVENLVNYTQSLGMKPTLKSMYTPNVRKLFDDNGTLLDPKYEARIEPFLDELIELTSALATIQKHSVDELAD